MFQKSCVSRLFDTVRCNFVRLYQYQTKKIILARSALTFSSGRFQSISHAKRGVRCPLGIETRLNFHSARSGKTIQNLCNFQFNFHLILSEAPIQPHTHPHASAHCALCIMHCELREALPSHSPLSPLINCLIKKPTIKALMSTFKKEKL